MNLAVWTADPQQLSSAGCRLYCLACATACEQVKQALAVYQLRRDRLAYETGRREDSQAGMKRNHGTMFNYPTTVLHWVTACRKCLFEHDSRVERRTTTTTTTTTIRPRPQTLFLHTLANRAKPIPQPRHPHPSSVVRPNQNPLPGRRSLSPLNADAQALQIASQVSLLPSPPFTASQDFSSCALTLSELPRHWHIPWPPMLPHLPLHVAWSQGPCCCDGRESS